MDRYDVGLGLLQGLQRGLGSYVEADERKKERAAALSARAAERESDRDFQRGLIEAKFNMENSPEAIENKMRIARAAAEGRNPFLNLSPGQEAADKAFGKEYAEYEAGGGKAAVDKNIGLLKEAVSKLKAPGQISGGWTTKIPFLSSDVAQEVINPEGVAVRDSIRQAIQGTLRQTLGAQFTEKEGQAIFERAYNPRLSDEENIRRAEAEIAALENQARQKEMTAKRFREKGSIAGGLIGGDTSSLPETKTWNGKTYIKQGDMWVEAK